MDAPTARHDVPPHPPATPGSSAAVTATETGAAARVRAAYARIAEADRPEVWIALRAEEEALADAEEVDRRVATGEELPLAGATLAVKDNIDLAGIRRPRAVPPSRRGRGGRRRRWSGSPPRAPSCSARRTSTSSPRGSSAHAARTAPYGTSGGPTACRAGPVPARRCPWRSTSPTWRSARTRPARAACR